MTEEYFISIFNGWYPFERYIFKTPAKINSLFDDLFVTELFIPSSEIKPMLNPDGSLMRFTEVPTDEIFVKDDDDEEELKAVLESQQTLIEKKYGTCNMKDHVSIYNNKENQP